MADHRFFEALFLSTEQKFTAIFETVIRQSHYCIMYIIYFVKGMGIYKNKCYIIPEKNYMIHIF